MPKVFRPKFASTTNKEASDTPSVASTRPRSPSPPPVVCERPAPLVSIHVEESVPSPSFALSGARESVSHSVPTSSANSTRPVVNTCEVKICDQVPNSELDLFASKKAKRIRSKEGNLPLPDVDKPLDRSAVSLRSLLRWVPATKPPPQYRQERSQNANTSPKATSNEAESNKNDVCELLKPIPTPAQTPANIDMLAPQLRLDASGNIVLDESSLLVSIPTSSSTDNIRHVVEETGVLNVTYKSFRPVTDARGTPWKPSETLRFYRALSTLGCDFYLMSKLFPDRSRLELKRKFKRESRVNPSMVNQTLRNRRNYDLTALVPMCDEDITDNQSIPDRKKVQKPRSGGKRTKQQKAYDPASLDETIDRVLAQFASSSSGGQRDPDSVSNHPGHRNSAPESALLNKMISKKQAELKEVNLANQCISADCEHDRSVSIMESQEKSAVTLPPPSNDPSLPDSINNFGGRSVDLVRVHRELLGE